MLSNLVVKVLLILIILEIIEKSDLNNKTAALIKGFVIRIIDF